MDTAAGGADAGGTGPGPTLGDVTVRRATRDDMPLIHQMIHELAAYEGYPNGPQLSVEDLITDGFECSPAWFFALVASVSGQPAGYALCSRAYSSWTRRAYYVEDLYVRAWARRRGAGRALLRCLAEQCVAEGAGRVDWHVLESNAPALAFYRGLGARDLRRSEGRAALRLDEPQIRALAAGLPTPPTPPTPLTPPPPSPHHQ